MKESVQEVDDRDRSRVDDVFSSQKLGKSLISERSVKQRSQLDGAQTALKLHGLKDSATSVREMDELERSLIDDAQSSSELRHLMVSQL